MPAKRKPTHGLSSHIELLLAQRAIVRRTKRHQTIGVLLLSLFLMAYFLISLTLQKDTLDSNTSDIVYGGITSKEEALLEFDRPDSSLRMLSEKLSIDRKSIENSQEKTSWNTSSFTDTPLVVWSRSPNYQPAQDPQHTFSASVFTIKQTTSSSLTSLYYGTPLASSSTYSLEDKPALIGQTKTHQPFAIMENSGNIISGWNEARVANFCYKTPDNDAYIHCPNATSLSTSVKVTNMHYNTDAHFLKSKPGDTLQYTLVSKNNSALPITLRPTIDINDILEYAALHEYGEAQWDKTRNHLTWPVATLNPQQEIQRTFTVKIKDPVPLVKQNGNNPRSHDCRLSTYYGGLDTIEIICPPAKVIERFVASDTPIDTVSLGAWSLLFMSSLLLIRNNIVYNELTKAIEATRRRIAP